MQYDKDELYQLNIHDLRTIARAIGVKAPTALNKRTLIAEILQIQRGEKQPTAPSKRGRPVRKCLELVDINKEKASVATPAIQLDEKLKQQCIDRILKEIEKQLNKIL